MGYLGPAGLLTGSLGYAGAHDNDKELARRQKIRAKATGTGAKALLCKLNSLPCKRNLSEKKSFSRPLTKDRP